MQAHSNAPRSVVRPSQHAGGRRRRDTPGPAARGRGLTTRTCMRDPNGLAVAGGPGAARRHGRPAGHWTTSTSGPPCDCERKGLLVSFCCSFRTVCLACVLPSLGVGLKRDRRYKNFFVPPPAISCEISSENLECQREKYSMRTKG